MTRPANTTTRPHADAEIVERLGGEDPARFLYQCGTRSVTLTVRSLIKGMEDPERIALWRKVEHQQFSGRRGVLTLLDRAEARIRGDDQDGATAAQSTGESPTATGDTPAHDASIQADDPVVRDDEYEAKLTRARSLVESFGADTCQARLREERDREEPRAHVIEALEERLKDLNAAPKSAKNSQTQEVSG